MVPLDITHRHAPEHQRSTDSPPDPAFLCRPSDPSRRRFPADTRTQFTARNILFGEKSKSFKTLNTRWRLFTLLGLYLGSLYASGPLGPRWSSFSLQTRLT